MPEITSYEPGEPCWAGVFSPAMESSLAFYHGLFGWDYYTITHPEVGDYTMFTLGEETIAGLRVLADDTMPAGWVCTFNVRDATMAAVAVREAGGDVLVEPTTTANLGRVVLAADPQGAECGLWEPYAWQGAAVVLEPNTMCRVELACRDLAAAERFYGHVLGWKQPSVFGGVPNATSYEWKVTDRPTASVVCTDEPLPGDDVPTTWRPCFAVADCDATAAEAERLGGTVTYPCTDTAHGRYAALRDPTAASFAVIELPD